MALPAAPVQLTPELVIRNKIIGQANMALESYNTPLNWEAIKQCLNTHYADKRDISTLEYELNTLIQGRNTVEEFYQKVYKQFSLILNKLSNAGMNRTTENSFIESYRKKALDTFIRGLNGDLPRLLAVHEPTDLPQALYMCTKLANQNYRTQFANQRMPNTAQQVPNRYPQNTNRSHQYRNTQYTQQQFYPQLTHFGRNTQQQSQNNHNNNFNRQNPNQNTSIPPPRPTAPKPQPAPQRMEVDQSIRSQVINYANRPRQNPGWTDRNGNYAAQATHNQYKQQRNFHIDMQTTNYNHDAEETEEGEGLTLTEYMEEYDRNNYEDQNENYIDSSDIHFLG